jgi:hypothetical protein
MLQNIISSENKNWSLYTAYLSKNQDFRLIYAVDYGIKQKSLLFASLAFRDIFYTQSYAELVWIKEMLKIFSYEKNSDITDGENFIVSQKKHENGLIQKSLHLKFIKGINVYLDRAEARTIATLISQVILQYGKKLLLEKNAFQANAPKIGMYHESSVAKAQLDAEIEQMKQLKLPKELHEKIIASIIGPIATT